MKVRVYENDVIRYYVKLRKSSGRFNFQSQHFKFTISNDLSSFLNLGRGWLKQGAHTSGYNRISIGVAFIGNYNWKIPNQKQLNAAFYLFEEGIKIKALKPDYKVFGALQLRNTESPGKAFFELIKTWKHWSAN